jgi:diacylglycerol kinase family enzyme
VRALLIVNPQATSTTRLRRDVIVRALASAVDLEVVQTRYRGDATGLAADARRDGYGLILTLGGDGTVNEAVNGILGPPWRPAGDGPAGDGPAGDGPAGDSPAGGSPVRPPAAELPALAPLPGGSANVFTRALGLPADPVDAAGWILQALTDGRRRDIGVGLADDRYFAFNAGLGFDAEVVRAVEGQRAHGRTVTPALYAKTAVRQFYLRTDRGQAALTLERDGHPPAGPFFIGIVSNTAPWTYLGRRAVNTNPRAAFDCGLDVFALGSLNTAATLRTLRQLLSPAGPPARGRSVLTGHDEAALAFTATRPVAFQIDGEYMGEREGVRFVSIPDALSVIV